MEVLSEADNAKHDSYRRESPLSVMLAIHQRACAKGEDVDYEKIAKVVSRGKTADFVDDCRRYAKFVANYSSGPDGCLLHSIDKFVKCVSLLREVPADFYGELAEVPCSQAPATSSQF